MSDAFIKMSHNVIFLISWISSSVNILKSTSYQYLSREKNKRKKIFWSAPFILINWKLRFLLNWLYFIKKNEWFIKPDYASSREYKKEILNYPFCGYSNQNLSASRILSNCCRMIFLKSSPGRPFTSVSSIPPI